MLSIQILHGYHERGINDTTHIKLVFTDGKYVSNVLPVYGRSQNNMEGQSFSLNLLFTGKNRINK